MINYKQKWRWTFMKRCILLWTLPETAIAEPFALFCMIIFSAVGRTFVLGTVATFELFTEVEIGLNLLWRYLESVLCRLVWFWSRLILLCSFSLFFSRCVAPFLRKNTTEQGIVPSRQLWPEAWSGRNKSSVESSGSLQNIWLHFWTYD